MLTITMNSTAQSLRQRDERLNQKEPLETKNYNLSDCQVLIILQTRKQFTNLKFLPGYTFNPSDYNDHNYTLKLKRKRRNRKKAEDKP